MEKYIAHCACNAVQVEIAGAPAVMAYCHCQSCRSWLGAPVHTASLWPTSDVNVTQGEALLGVYKRTEESHRQFCTQCGSPVLIRHPNMGMTDVPAGNVTDLTFEAAFHVHYAEHILPVRDGLPKFVGMPAADGSGDTLDE